MPKTLSLLTLTSCVLVLFSLPARAVPDIVPAGTILQCTLDEPNFSSKTAMVGDPLLCHLASVSSFGHSAFPRGAMLSGHLDDYKNPGHLVGKGWLQLQFDRIVLPGGVLPIAAKVIAAPRLNVDKEGKIHGKGHAKRDAVEWMVPILWPIKIATLPARGPYPTLKGETRVTLRLMEDVELPMPIARNVVPMPPWATPSSFYSYDDREATQGATGARKEPATSQVTIIALKGGTAYLATQYWVQGGQMHFVSLTGEDRLLPLEKIDLSETTRVNQERKVTFIIQSRNTDIPLISPDQQIH
jgi:hypothetical protein